MSVPAIGPLSGIAAVPPVPVWRLSVERYHAMIRSGILTENDAVELLDGWLVPRMTKNPPHRIATRRVRRALERVTPNGWYVDSQEPITLAASEPEPDGVVVRGESSDYPDRHPGPEDVALVVEVADVTLEHDRTFKKAVYARAGIPVYWIVNLIDRRLEAHADPSGSAAPFDYRQRREYAPDDEAPLVLGGREIARIRVRELLP